MNLCSVGSYLTVRTAGSADLAELFQVVGRGRPISHKKRETRTGLARSSLATSIWSDRLKARDRGVPLQERRDTACQEAGALVYQQPWRWRLASVWRSPHRRRCIFEGSRDLACAARYLEEVARAYSLQRGMSMERRAAAPAHVLTVQSCPVASQCRFSGKQFGLSHLFFLGERAGLEPRRLKGWC